MSAVEVKIVRMMGQPPPKIRVQSKKVLVIMGQVAAFTHAAFPMYFSYSSKISCIETGVPIEIAAVKVDDPLVCFHERAVGTATTLLSRFLAFLEKQASRGGIVLIAHGAHSERALLEAALTTYEGMRLPPNTTWECTLTRSGDKNLPAHFARPDSALADALYIATLWRSLFEDPRDAEFAEGLAAVHAQEEKELRDAEEARIIWEGMGE